MKRLLALLCVMMLLAPAALAVEQDDRPFAFRFGDRESNKICITVDDNYDAEFTRQCFELSKQYNVPITFFVLGYALDEKDAELWREIADSNCEIGNHTNVHLKLAIRRQSDIIAQVLLCQEKLDAVLGYHYEMVSLRPPYGGIYNKAGSNANTCRAVRKTGLYWHVILWDVAETDYDKALKKTKNGSVLLFHAKKADVKCLTKLIPALLNKGFEFVTTSEMFGLGEVTRSDELYVFDKKLYQ